MVDKFLFIVVKDLIINPVRAWEKISSENKQVSVTRNTFLIPSIILISLSAIAGSLLFKNAELSPVYSLLIGIKCFILFYVTVYLSAIILKEITYPLDLGRSFQSSYLLIVYSIVPFMLCQVISRIFESLLFINVLALFGLHIFWTGADKLLSPPGYKKMPLLIASFIAFSAIYISANLLFTMLTDRIFSAFFS